MAPRRLTFTLITAVFRPFRAQAAPPALSRQAIASQRGPVDLLDRSASSHDDPDDHFDLATLFVIPQFEESSFIHTIQAVPPI